MTSTLDPLERPNAVAAAPVAPRRVAAPCVATDDGAHCVLGLLLGVACCPDGACAFCADQRAWSRRSGFAESDIERSFARSREGLLSRCPLCGFPPPTPVETKPALARLPRSECMGTGRCRICGTALSASQRQYCSDACWLQRRRETEGWGAESASPRPPRVARFARRR